MLQNRWIVICLKGTRVKEEFLKTPTVKSPHDYETYFKRLTGNKLYSVFS